MLVDRETSRIAFVVSTEGGMDIEAVAHDTPEKISDLLGRSRHRHHARIMAAPVAQSLGLNGDARQAGRGMLLDQTLRRLRRARTWRCWRSTR